MIMSTMDVNKELAIVLEHALRDVMSTMDANKQLAKYVEIANRQNKTINTFQL